MKLLAILSLGLTLTACGQVSRIGANLTGNSVIVTGKQIGRAHV